VRLRLQEGGESLREVGPGDERGEANDAVEGAQEVLNDV